MSKGDELWRIRDGVLRGLYGEGAITPRRAVRAVLLLKGVIEGARPGEEGSEEERNWDDEEVKTLMRWLAEEGLIDGAWRTGSDTVYLTREGFEKAGELCGQGKKPSSIATTRAGDE